ncbi:MAG: NAD(P)-dependent oxidoreductase, partial [Xanthomonadales bacterium]|nr:NAD(P)-dependent oxidoreductase [Xanthomonadales bacterium]
LHYSTDYVFAGDGRAAYRETDVTAPLGAYGRSKLAGEQALAASGAAHIIVRTAWVYAARGHNFLLSMLRLARERDELRVVADQIGAPTPAGLIAHASAAMLAQWLVLDSTERKALGGLYHLTSAGQASWFEFATAIVTGAQRIGLLERAPTVVPITSAQYPTPAQRPAWSVLDCAHVQSRFGLHLPAWQTGLDSVLIDLRTS